MMKKIALIFLLFIFIVGLHLVAKDKVLLKLPVRVISKTGPELSLKKNDFSFYINEHRKEIIDLLGQKRSLDQTDEPRNFVLAFNLTEYGRQISDGIIPFCQKCSAENR